jgi:hypothetical protein
MSECLQAHKQVISTFAQPFKLEDEKTISLLILRMRYVCMDPKTADPSFVNPSDLYLFDFCEDPFLRSAALLAAASERHRSCTGLRNDLLRRRADH